jgi:hypothetical protein
MCVCVENAFKHEQIIQPLPAMSGQRASCMRRMAWGDPTAPVGRRLKVFDDNPQPFFSVSHSPFNHDVSICTRSRRPTKALTQANKQTAHH